MLTLVRVVIIEEHDPAWTRHGTALADSLRGALAPLALHVDHIGSTSIPGMAAKLVFDLQVSVADLDEAEHAFIRPLSLRGFELTPYRRDHVPAGRDDPPDRWVKRLWARRDHPEPDVNLHVRLLGSANERLALLFRDWFRAHPEAIPGYARFKRSLAAAVPDLGIYSDVKDDVVDVIVAVAESWAVQAGWAPHSQPVR